MTEPTAILYGWQALTYLSYLVFSYIEPYPWQVKVSYAFIGLSALTIVILFFRFMRMIRIQHRQKRATNRAYDKYAEGLRRVLLCPNKLEQEEMEYIIGADASQLRKVRGYAMARLMMRLRLEQPHTQYIPNLQKLCQITGVVDYLENRLVNNKDVDPTLQILITFPLRVNEGGLAMYLHHRNFYIREFARSYYGFCSLTEPFLFVNKDVDEPFTLYHSIAFHRLCGWHQAQGHPMPRFLALCDRSHNEEKQAMFIAEVPYYGTSEEKRDLPRFLSSTSKKSCFAAIRALRVLGDPESEDALVRHYDNLFPEAKREVLRAVAHINTGKRVDFFRRVYVQSSSLETRMVALTCLFRYGEEGRRVFNELLDAGLDEKRLFQQVETVEFKND